MKALLSYLWFGFLLFTLSSTSYGADRYLMAALGDSISAAFLATTTLQDPDATDLSTIHFGLSDLLTNRYTLSWSTGLQIQSHLVRLRRALALLGDDGELTGFNFAYPGDTSRQMYVQAEKLLAKKRIEGFNSVKYVTVMFGANDACTPHVSGGIPDETMKANLERGFDELARISQSEPIRVLVAGIPRIPDLGKPGIVARPTLGGLTCGEFRRYVFDSCARMVDWKTDAEYHDRLADIERRNGFIQQAVDDASRAHPNLQIVYTNEMYESPISYKLLAVDCFHPNIEGQELIATKLWAAQPWFR